MVRLLLVSSLDRWWWTSIFHDSDRLWRRNEMICHENFLFCPICLTSTIISSVKGQENTEIWCFSSPKAVKGFLSGQVVPSLIWSLVNITVLVISWSSFSKGIWGKKKKGACYGIEAVKISGVTCELFQAFQMYGLTHISEYACNFVRVCVYGLIVFRSEDLSCS